MNKNILFKRGRQFSSAGLLACLIGTGYAANPILHGFADPAMRVWNDKLYLCVGKDLSATHKGFAMPYWAIYSSTNLVDWQPEKVINPELVSYMGKGNMQCWAADIAFANNRFYFYFSDGGKSTGVLVADTPDGEYQDVLKKPLVAPTKGNLTPYDPTIFTDTDGTPYLTFGRDGHLAGDSESRHYQIAKLNPDLISFAEAPKDLLTDREYGFGSATRATDHSYFHKHNDTYYLSRDENYMTSKSVYGPFERLRQCGQPGHSSFVSYHGQWYHAYEFTDDEFGVRTYRQTMITYLHYKENGDMVDDRFFIKGGPGFAYGVGNYNADWDKLEAEWFFAIGGGEKKESPVGGFEIQNLTNGCWLKFPQVKNLVADSRISFQISSANPHGGKILIHQGGPEGPLLGTCEVPCTKGWDRYQLVSSNLRNAAGTADLCLVFEGEGELMRLDWLTFRPAK